MNFPPIDSSVKAILNQRLKELEDFTNSDFLVFYGPIVNGMETMMRKIVEDIAADNKKDRLFVILTTGGGSAIAVERYVNIIRHFYPNEVNFIIPDYAYSAGTIFSMSGDNIYMDYFSVLGPIDPQVQNKEGRWVAALGYLDKVNELIEKARKGELTDAEFVILKEFDLAELRGYEQAKELTIDLLKKWLVKYKFKNWNQHQTTNPGTAVTVEQKQKRAEEIADALSNNQKWKSHGRPISMEGLQDLRLKIENLDSHPDLKKLIRQYYDLVSALVSQQQRQLFIHTRKYL